jgi:glycosyltransferase involved in cell wall biosynthesis
VGATVVSSTLKASEVDSVKRQRPADAPFRVLFVGYFRPEKGIDVLLKAFARVLAKIPNAELALAGAQDLVEGGAAQEAEAALAQLSARATVVRYGALPFGPRLFQAFADADVLALPSRSEGTPRVLVEARAFGCPVVASRVGGVPSSVRDGVDGLLVPPENEAALAEALLRVAHEPQLREGLVREGLERAKTLTVDAQAETMLAQLALVMR